MAANVAIERANKKKENPYLAHRSVGSTSEAAGASATALQSSDAAPAAALPTAVPSVAVDERLPQGKRDLRGRKGLHFIEAGKLVHEAERIKAKEERKIIAGYASGRKHIQQQQPLPGSAEGAVKEVRKWVSDIE